MGLRDRIFFRSLGLVYFLAFGSLIFQIKGLIGVNGILPVSDLLSSVRQSSSGFANFLQLPTIFWLNSSDEFMRVICIVAIFLSVALFLKLRIWQQTAIMFLLYVFYLSFINVGQNFLSFQWDVLLLETGFLSVLYLVFYRSELARKVFIWLFRLLIFKLMLMSGLVKFSSGDAAWANMTALSYHYLTQPLPNPISFFVYQLPIWFHWCSCVLMFVIELIIPWLIFMGRRPRIWAALAFTALMLMVIVTGNYCFFNLLTIALCLWLVDDEWLEGFLPVKKFNSQFFANPMEILNFKIKERLLRLGFASEDFAQKSFRLLAHVFILLIFLYYSVVHSCLIISRAPIPLSCRVPFAQLSETLLVPVQNFHLISPYGLFAIMTTIRNEIVIQGANDVPGQLALSDWLDYEFYWKPGDTKAMPSQVAPYQPRLDWQMWFAALSDYRAQAWFVNFCIRILQNNKDVLHLLKNNPYPDAAPKYIRAVVYEYKFNDLETYARSGEPWQRDLKELYLPAISLR
jgi:hypothetical protein